MKRSKLIVLVLALVMSFAMIAVACDDSADTPPAPEVYTVTFKDGDTTVKSVDVNAGSALAAADIPAAPATGEDKAFEGWYAGDTAVAAGYTPAADVTASAKYTQLKKVDFKIGDEIVKTVYVRPGAKIAADQLPAEVDMPAYSFAGWYVGDEPFDTDEDTVDADIVLEADYVKIAYVIKFVNGDDEVSVEYIDLGQDAKLSASDIPAGPSAGQGEIFLGWYNGAVKAEPNAAISADAVYKAAFVSETSYDGVWYNDDEGLMAVLDYNEGITAVTVMGQTNKEFTYDAAAGTCSYSEGALSSKKTYTLTVIGDILTIGFAEYNEYEEYVTTTYALTKGTPVEYAGKYVKDSVNSSYMTVTDGGVISYYNTPNIYYARLFADGSAYKLAYRVNASADVITADADIDEKGNIVVTGGTGVNNSYKGMYVKDVADVSYYNYDSSYYLYDYTLTGGEHLYVYNDNFQSFSYATVEGTVETDAVLTVTVGDDEYVVKIINSYKMEFASDERGEYTGVGTDVEGMILFLDGFGTATAEAEGSGSELVSIDYYMIGNIAVFADGGSGAMTIDKSAMTFGPAVSDGKEASFSEYDGSVKLKFDGYGGVVETNYYNRYVGTYEFGSDGNTVTITGTDSSDGVYNVLESGKVLEGDDESNVFIDDTYTVQSGIQDFVGANDGWWQSEADTAVYVVIDTEKSKITYNEEVINYEANWRGTKLEFRIYVSGSGYIYYTVTVVDSKLNISYVDTDETPVTETYVSAPQPVLDADGYESIYVGVKDSNLFIITLDGFKGANLNGEEAEYVINGNKIMVGDEYVGGYEIDLTSKKAEYYYDGMATGSAFNIINIAGYWKNSNNVIVQFLTDGTVSYDGNVVSYNVSAGKITFTANYNDYTVTGVDTANDKITISYYDGDAMTDVALEYERYVPVADAIAGTYTFDTWSLVFDGFGQVTVTRGAEEETVNYTLSGKIAEFTALTCDFECTIKDNGNLNVLADSGDTFNNVEFVKQASEALDAFAGTWTGKVGANTYTVICDGKGNININDTDYTYTAGSDTISVGYFTVTMNNDKMHVVFDDGEVSVEGDLVKS